MKTNANCHLSDLSYYGVCAVSDRITSRAQVNIKTLLSLHLSLTKVKVLMQRQRTTYVTLEDSDYRSITIPPTNLLPSKDLV